MERIERAVEAAGLVLHKRENTPANQGRSPAFALAEHLQRFGDIAPDSESYPYLALSRRLGLDYGAVLMIADVGSERAPHYAWSRWALARVAELGDREASAAIQLIDDVTTREEARRRALPRCPSCGSANVRGTNCLECGFSP